MGLKLVITNMNCQYNKILQVTVITMTDIYEVLYQILVNEFISCHSKTNN